MAADRTPPPTARREPAVRDLHGDRVVDDYAWMHLDAVGLRDYLAAERRHYESRTAHYQDLQAALYREMVDRVAPTDHSVNWPHGKWLYYTQTASGKQYRDFCRRSVTDGNGQVVLSENDLAEGHAYLAIGVRELSPDGRLLAYSVDTDGDEVYELRVRDLETGTDLADVIPRSYYGLAWAADSSGFLYTVHDEAYRPNQVLLHRIGTDPADDVVVFDEPDQRFELTVGASRSGEFALIECECRDTTETWLVPAGDLAAPPRVVHGRRPGIEYRCDHTTGPDGGRLWMVTNDGAEEFRVMSAPVAAPGRDHWVEAMPSRPGERILRVDAFASHLVVTLRSDGRPLLRVVDLATGAVRDEGTDPAAAIRLACNDDEHEPVRDPYDTGSVTIVTESLIDPPTWWALDLTTGERIHLRTQATPGWERDRYRTERLVATAADGAEIPVTIAVPADRHRAATPLLLYGYGAYESVIDPWFDPAIGSLLDRGVSFAIAHVRGGGERGHHWWQQGRLAAKPNTFDDFVAVADMLAGSGWADGVRIASRGLSAGGLLQGAAFSRAPHRWRVVVAEVPFVDVVNSMLDPTVPLTVNEWDEWGDPRKAEDYAVMRSYSPYENPPDGPRPDLLVTGSLHDPRVLIREPAKWVARLRATQTDDSIVLFRPELGAAAHVGPSGRYDRLRYEAEVLAFVLTSLGTVDPTDARPTAVSPP